MRTRSKCYGETRTRKRKLLELYPDSDSSSSFSSICSSKMNSLTPDQDQYMLRYLYDAAIGNIALGESYTYNWWTRIAQKLSKNFATSIGTDTCIRASSGHQALYLQYYKKSRHVLTHPNINSTDYHTILDAVYNRNRRNALSHPSLNGCASGSGSGSGGPIRRSRSGSRGYMHAGGSDAGGSAIFCHSDSWEDWEEILTPILEDLYMKDLLTSLEVDMIAKHFKVNDTRVGIKLFQRMNLDVSRVKYVKDTLANLTTNP